MALSAPPVRTNDRRLDEDVLINSSNQDWSAPVTATAYHADSARLRTLGRADLERIAQIHSAAFPSSFLTVLGPRALRLYYRWLLEGPHNAIALAIGPEDEIAAYAFGGLFSGTLAGFVQRNWMSLSCCVLKQPWILLDQRWRRRLETGLRSLVPFLRCEAKTRPLLWPPARTFGLLVIAVDPRYSRSGYGTKLMNACERVAADREFSGMTLTVHRTNQHAIRFYERLGWAKVQHEGRWNGMMSRALSRTSLELENGEE